MADIAEIGFAYNPAGLKKAKADLDAILPSAKKVEAAKLAVAKADLESARAALAAAKASGSASKEQIAAANSAVKKANASLAAARADQAAAGAAAAVGKMSAMASGDLDRMGNSAQNATTKLARLGTSANDNLNAVQATPANIAAQFQDIGVTAAAGMNPMLIALQQGTQLSVAFSNGFGGIGAALKQLLSPTALLTIGLVGLAAAGLQMIDWVEVGKSALYGLATALEVAAPYAAGLAAALLLLNSPAIISGIWNIAKAVWALAAGLLAAASVPTLIVVGLVAIIAAAIYFRDVLTSILGFDIVESAKTGVNAIIGFFVGGYNGIVKSWGMIAPAIDDILAQAVQYSRKRIEQMINSAIDGINTLLAGLPDWMKVGSGQIARVTFDNVPNPNAGMANKVGGIMSGEMNKAQGVDYVGKGVALVEQGGRYLAGKLRGIADGLGKEKDKKKKDGVDKATGKTDAEKFTDITEGADRRIAALEAERKMIGIYGEALYTAKAKQDMMNEAMQKGLTLDEAQLKIIEQKAAKIGELTAANEKAAFMEEQRVNHEQRIEALKMEQATLGLYSEELRRATIENDLLLEAKQRHIDLNPEEIAAIKRSAAEQAALEEKIKKQRDAIATAKEVTRGFFNDIYEGAKKGKNVFEVFADAISNTVDRIVDKLVNSKIDQIIEQLFNGKKGSGGGFFDKLITIFTGEGGFGTGANPDGTMSANGDPANPGLFAAKGHAFSNSVVHGVTPFAFGKGGANLGIMGEAGPEAVMPLTRGPGGSLGVQMYGNDNSRGSTPAINVNVNNYHTVSGAISSEDVVNLTKRSAEKTKQELKAQVPQIIEQYRRDGSFAA